MLTAAILTGVVAGRGFRAEELDRESPIASHDGWAETG